MHEYEVVQYNNLKYVNMIFNSISYRSPHMHREFELIYNLKGETIYSVGAKSIHLKEGSFLIFNPNQVHEIRSASPGPFTICLQVAPEFFEPVRSDMEFLSFDSFFLKDYKKRDIPEMLLKLSKAYLSREENYEFYCSSLIYMIFSQLLKLFPYHFMSGQERKSSLEKTQRINRILKYGQLHYNEKASLSELARLENLSVTYLSRFIKENLNRSFQSYIGELRFNNAKRLVISSDKALIDICEECGYSNYRYFYQDFIKNCNCSPNDYRLSQKDDGAGGQSPRFSVEERLSPGEALERLNFNQGII